MATVSAASVRFASLKPASRSNQANGVTSGVMLVTIGTSKLGFPSLRSSRFRVHCAAKPETVNKVIDIVKRQLALSDDTSLTPESKFSSLGADSLDTVEIVMCLEEAFDISVDEDNSQNITTVQEAAELIEKLVLQKAEAA